MNGERNETMMMMMMMMMRIKIKLKNEEERERECKKYIKSSLFISNCVIFIY
jgi:hypothetical protein